MIGGRVPASRCGKAARGVLLSRGVHATDCGRVSAAIIVHPGHSGMVAAAHVHAHVLHGEQRARAQWRNRRRHAFTRRERRAAKPRAVDRLADHGVGAVARGHDHIVSLGDSDLEFVDRHGTNILPVGRDDGHRQVRNADVEIALRGGIDDPQADAFAGLEQPGPIVRRTVPVDGVGVDRSRHIGDVGGVHSHLRPLAPFGGRKVTTGKLPGQGQSLMIEIAAAHLLQFAEDRRAAHGAMVRQDEDMLAIINDRVRACRIDHDRSVEAVLFLIARVAVIPIGARLDERKFVDEGRARGDAGKADPRNPVHREWHQQPVPVDRAFLVERVGDVKADLLAFLEADQRRGNSAIDPDRATDLAVDPHRDFADSQRDVIAADGRERAHESGRKALRPRRREPGQAGAGSAERCGAQEIAPRKSELVEHRISLIDHGSVNARNRLTSR